MKHTLTFALAGGDVRQAYLGELLAADGAQVRTIGLERSGTELEAGGAPRTLFAEADVILLPMPVMGTRGRLNAPLANAPYKLTDVLDAIPAGKPVYGGSVPRMVRDMAARRGIEVQDYLEREELALLNAIPTAEGAIQIAMEELPVTLHGLPVLVIGAGRIGMALAPRLRGLGAHVTVSARRYDDFARLRSGGYHYLDTRRLAGQLHAFPLVINTVPSPVLTRRVLADCAPDALIIDLASGKGGIADDAGDLCRVIHALSLPGRVAPRSAAAAIYDTVCHMLEEEGLL
ncbi:dipicolinate synthase subunit DpsA [Butyricicoccus sp.]|uniref:dipicolinate synthase subunit DpsA n=1 Tax=Butyricicoccus sp. TaxID=2049021 RepID=UPI003F187367